MQYFLPVLTIVFVVAKITGYLAWSWWWVFSPFWIGIPLALLLVFFGSVLIALSK